MMHIPACVGSIAKTLLFIVLLSQATAYRKQQSVVDEATPVSLPTMEETKQAEFAELIVELEALRVDYQEATADTTTKK